LLGASASYRWCKKQPSDSWRKTEKWLCNEKCLL
jgi:hypothetical protein